MNKKGFTIAEVFIALAIVGALTVILFPVVQKSSPDQNKIMLRKTFNTLSQAVSNMSYDDVNYPETPEGTTTDTGQSVPPGFNNQSGSYTAGTKFCTLLAQQLNTIGPVDCAKSVTCNTVTSTWGTFTTADGVDWRIYEGPGTVCKRTCTDSECNTTFPINRSNHAYQSKIIVDVNGSAKGPNCSNDHNASSFGLTKCNYLPETCNMDGLPMPDIYIIGVRYDGNLRIGSSDSFDTSVADGDACGELILDTPTSNSSKIF